MINNIDIGMGNFGSRLMLIGQEAWYKLGGESVILHNRTSNGELY